VVAPQTLKRYVLHACTHRHVHALPHALAKVKCRAELEVQTKAWEQDYQGLGDERSKSSFPDRIVSGNEKYYSDCSPEHTDIYTAAVLRYKDASQYRRVDGGLWPCISSL